MARKINLFVLVAYLIALCVSTPQRAEALPKMHGDNPNDFELKGTYYFEGNPLEEGDWVYSLRGWRRLSSGRMGLGGALGYAEPSSAFARSAGNDPELFMLDFSVVWYLNYPRLHTIAAPSLEETSTAGSATEENRKSMSGGGLGLKYELYVSAGPGLAYLRTKDVLAPAPLSDASQSFFTLNAGFGAKLHFLKTDPGQWLEHYPNQWYLRPELQARWFDGGGGNIDLGIGLAIGRSFGNRPSPGVLYKEVYENYEQIGMLLTKANRCYPSEGGLSDEGESLLSEALATGRYVSELHAHVERCGRRCASLRSYIEKSREKVTRALDRLRECSPESVQGVCCERAPETFERCETITGPWFACERPRHEVTCLNGHLEGNTLVCNSQDLMATQRQD